jgi:hypothetical protein
LELFYKLIYFDISDYVAKRVKFNENSDITEREKLVASGESLKYG